MNVPYLKRYRNAEYLQYMTDFSDLLKKQDLDALQLTAKKAVLDPVINEIEAIFKQSQGSELTKEIIALDERRDRAIVGLRGVTDSYKYHYNGTVAQAATALNDNILTHGDTIQRLSYQEETAVLNSIIKDWETELKEAVMELGLSKWLAELKQSNTLFSAKYLERVGETASNPTINITELRIKATDAYRILVKHIEAYATLGGSDVYATLLNQIDILAGQYNQLVDNRTKTSDAVEEEV